MNKLRLKTYVLFSVARSCTLAVFIATGFLSACSDSSLGNSSSGNVNNNQVVVQFVISPPTVQKRRATVPYHLTPIVFLSAGDLRYNAIQSNSSSFPWIGEAFVPEGLVASVSVLWVETDVDGLPEDSEGRLPLAFYSGSTGPIGSTTTVNIPATANYITQSTDDHPELDLDGDGASNLEERIAGSGPNDPEDLPLLSDVPEVFVFYNDQGPVIDGLYDPIWASYAQFRDRDSMNLGFENEVLLPDNGLVDPSMANDFNWAAMHDGSYLYLMVLAESGNNQTPFADSESIYNDDSVDIYWDGNLSGGYSYDGVDDFHVAIGLLAENGEANNSSAEGARIDVFYNSSPIDDLTSIQYAVDLSNGVQQMYEFRLDLEALKIPIGPTFGFEIEINNDADGGDRDAKWAWFNDSGIDDTYRFPSLMGSLMLEPLP